MRDVKTDFMIVTGRLKCDMYSNDETRTMACGRSC